MFPLNLYARVRVLFAQIARETAGAACTRSSLRPLIREGRKLSSKPRADHAARSRSHIQSSSPAKAGDPVFQRRAMIESISRGVLDPPRSGLRARMSARHRWRATRPVSSDIAALVRATKHALKPDNPRQHAPAEQRRIRRRGKFGRPARQFFQRVGIHHHAAPDALDPRQRLPLGGREIPQRQAMVRLARDIEAGMILDRRSCRDRQTPGTCRAR